MLLDRVDIDHHGPLNRVELGPFTETLNVVCGPEGSGKTAIVRFIRDSLVRREYPLGMMSSSGGRVVWADRNGRIHCRREQDGTATGRRTVEFECRGDVSHRFDWLHGSWIEGIADSTDATRAYESIRIPEMIVDGILTDTAVASVSRVVQACIQSGLTNPSLINSLPISASNVSGLSPDATPDEEAARRAMRDELARVEAELATYGDGVEGFAVADKTSASREAWVQARKTELRRRLAELQSGWPSAESYRDQFIEDPSRSHFEAGLHLRNSSGELAQLHDRIWQLRVRQQELHRWLSHLRTDLNRVRYTAPLASSPYATSSYTDSMLTDRHTVYPHGYQSHLRSLDARLDAELRTRLQGYDAQIIRWRRALAELQGLRQVILEDANRSMGSFDAWGPLPLSDQSLRRARMNQFLHALDHDRGSFDPVSLASTVPGYRDSNWPLEIDLRIDAIVRRIDELVTYYDRPQAFAPVWYQSLPRYSSAQVARDSSLVGSLAAIREDLVNVRRHGFRFAYHHDAARNQALAIRTESRLFDLRRTERWLVSAIERLMQDRSTLVRDHELAEFVRYPYWLEDGYDRQDWSVWYQDHLRAETSERTKELESVTAELGRCVEQAACLRRKMRSLPVIDPLVDQLGWGYRQAPAHPDYPSVGRYGTAQAEIDAIIAELRVLDTPREPAHQSADTRWHWLVRRRDEINRQLGSPRRNIRSGVPLADEASQWLVRLSGGRLRRVDWNVNQFESTNVGSFGQLPTGSIRIDGRDEDACDGVDRALSALAVRMAAASVLAHSGRSIPLVIEMHREWSADYQSVIAALNDYAQGGRQVIVLTSDRAFADQIDRRSGKVFELHLLRTERDHRPLWAPHFGHETYVGPHAGVHLANPPIDRMQYAGPYVDQYFDHGAWYASQDHYPTPAAYPSQAFNPDPVVNPHAESYPISDPILPPGSQLHVSAPAHSVNPDPTIADINRNLDAIWQDTYGVSGSHANAPIPHYSPSYVSASPRPPSVIPTSTPANASAGPWHDGYYYADQFTTSANDRAEKNAVTRDSTVNHGNATPETPLKRVSPFFLTVDSPIDQAPSIDAVATARLRGLNVTHVNHLLQQDPNRLSDALGLAGVTAATIRRWQSECRLVCNVPQLRGFDARVLVGCGIRDAGHLAATDPNDLLDRVEAFLATERGQRILLSGTSYELSRITSWIAAANVNVEDNPVIRMHDHQTIDGRVVRSDAKNYEAGETFDRDRYEYEFVDDDGEVVRATTTRSRSAGASNGQSRQTRRVRKSRSTSSRSQSGRSRSTSRRVEGNSSRSSSSGRSSRRSRSASGSLRQSSRRSNSTSNSRGAYERSARSVVEREPYQNEHRESSSERSARSSSRASESNRQRAGVDYQQRDDYDSSERELRFYLERESPVVDAPSIGNRMAEKLEAVGIDTVNDLLNADPAELAQSLEHRRIDAEVIISWQNQAILVCRIPMLRGHDAQLLVAADVTTPEEVSAYEPAELFALIDPIARSNEGKRIIRGGKLPDLEEITDWISYAAQNRDLLAA